MFDNEKNGYWENGSGAGNQSADQDGYVRPESQSADQGGYVRPESQSTDQGGYVRSESQSADQDGYVRTESQNTDQGGYVRSESQSADQQEAYTKRDYRNTSYIPQEREHFLLVLFAAVTSSIALTESAVSTFEDELGWNRKKATLVLAAIMVSLGSLSCLGYGPLANVTIIGMQFLDFFDFLTNSVMMPIAAIMICLLVSRAAGVKAVEAEVLHGEGTFRRKKIFCVMIKYICPIFAAIILISSVANAFGWISM